MPPRWRWAARPIFMSFATAIRLSALPLAAFRALLLPAPTVLAPMDPQSTCAGSRCGAMGGWRFQTPETTASGCSRRRTTPWHPNSPASMARATPMDRPSWSRSIIPRTSPPPTAAGWSWPTATITKSKRLMRRAMFAGSLASAPTCGGAAPVLWTQTAIKPCPVCPTDWWIRWKNWAACRRANRSAWRLRRMARCMTPKCITESFARRPPPGCPTPTASARLCRRCSTLPMASHWTVPAPIYLSRISPTT